MSSIRQTTRRRQKRGVVATSKPSNVYKSTDSVQSQNSVCVLCQVAPENGLFHRLFACHADVLLHSVVQTRTSRQIFALPPVPRPTQRSRHIFIRVFVLFVIRKAAAINIYAGRQLANVLISFTSSTFCVWLVTAFFCCADSSACVLGSYRTSGRIGLLAQL